MKIVSFFSGCGGLDLGFKEAGYDIIWANDNATSVKATFQHNFPETIFNDTNINNLRLEDIPSDAIGMIGGPPCQCWSNAGKGRGFKDSRGKVFLTFINILKSLILKEMK